MAKGNLKNYWVKWGTLYIHYTSKENFQQFTVQTKMRIVIVMEKKIVGYKKFNVIMALMTHSNILTKC